MQLKALEKLIRDSDVDKEFIAKLMELITTESKEKTRANKERDRRIIYEY